jgi:hypothetical protein
VVRLSLLCGSTWYVNTIVSRGSSPSCSWATSPRPPCGSAAGPRLPLPGRGDRGRPYRPTSWLLSIDSLWLRIGAAVVLYLAPVYFAALVFAMLIHDEPQLGRRTVEHLGAVTGGVCSTCRWCTAEVPESADPGLLSRRVPAARRAPSPASALTVQRRPT